MLQRIDQHNARQPPEHRIRVSVEIEKPREELFQLFSYGDVVSGPPLPQQILLASSRLLSAFLGPASPNSPHSTAMLGSVVRGGGTQTSSSGAHCLHSRWVWASRGQHPQGQQTLAVVDPTSRGRSRLSLGFELWGPALRPNSCNTRAVF